jgi:hypothetical protein
MLVTRTDRRRLLRLLWEIPLYSAGFALFFGTIFGRSEAGYRDSLKIALVFNSVILVLIRASELVMSRMRERWSARPLLEGIVYTLLSAIGSSIAAVMIDRWVLPGFLGGRATAIVVLFSLLFLVLFSALGFAWHFYNRSLDYARRDKELELARRIQSSFLPREFPTLARIDVHAMNRPSRGVSGDFYDVVADGRTLMLAVADVEGKSVPAALLTAMLQASIRTQAGLLRSPAAIVASVNQLVCRRVDHVQQFATFFFAQIDEQGRLRYTNAGHNPPLLLSPGGETRRLECGGMMLGVMDVAPYEEEALALSPGDRLVVYTDGISEREDPSGAEYGEERLLASLRTLPAGLPSQVVVERTLAALEAFAGGVEPADDQTLMVLSIQS